MPIPQGQVFHCSTNLLRPACKIAILVGHRGLADLYFPKEKLGRMVAQDKNWFLLGQAFAIVLIAHLFSFWRWQILVQAIGVPFTLLEAIRLGFLGTLLNLVSVGSVGGDVFKAIEAARKAEKKRAEVVASVLVDRAARLARTCYCGCALGFRWLQLVTNAEMDLAGSDGFQLASA